VAGMWFPAALSARLWGQRISRPFRGKPAPAIFHFSPLVRHFPPGALFEGVVPETEWHTPEACVQAANEVGAPAVWLGGVEPLLHPAIGKVTTALAQTGRYVFLDTAGADLRMRIHEFQPAERFFFAFQLSGDEIAQGVRAGCSDLQNVTEVLRIVKLSGFFACVHLVVGAQTSVAAMEPFFRMLEASRVDGIAASSGGASAGLASDAILGKRLAEITEIIPSRQWRKLSRILEASYLQTATVRERPNIEARGTDACEESA
jgi:hypothetical protein